VYLSVNVNIVTTKLEGRIPDNVPGPAELLSYLVFGLACKRQVLNMDAPAAQKVLLKCLCCKFFTVILLWFKGM
jgi:hypothetical protein